MTVDATLATFSDWCFAGAVIVYVLALVLHGVQFASGRDRAAQPELVAAGSDVPRDRGPRGNASAFSWGRSTTTRQLLGL